MSEKRAKYKTARVGISKRVRFEVFKRDSFTCQYCGKKAPEVILEVDHINPVSLGGSGDIMNLITACQDCNAGKSNKELSDDAVIKKQHAQLEALQERREQLDMLMQWKESLLQLDDYEVEKVIEFINNRIKPKQIINNAKAHEVLGGYKKRFGIDILITATEVAASQYLRIDTEGNPTEESIIIMLEKIPGICYNEKKYRAHPEQREVDYLRYEMQRTMYVNIRGFYTIINSLLRAGISIDEINETSKGFRNWTQWRTYFEQLLNEVSNG